ncbi:cytochrome P450 [Amylostereum chailletii]|nr:cytochrome P450 [Amylostereum chailletii]
MPNKNEWVVYREWCRKYNSDLVYAKTLGQEIIVLNTAKATKELFEKCSSLYSDRPALTALNDMFGFTWLTPAMPYGPMWRQQRKIYHSTMNPNAIQKYKPLEVKATHDLLSNALQDPDALERHFRHMAGQIIMSIAYGIDIKPAGDEWVELAEHAMTAFSLGTQFGGLIFDMLPFMRHMPWWFPGAGLKKDIPKYSRSIADVLEKPYRETEMAVARGDAPPSMAASIIKEQNTLPDSEKDRVSAQAVPAVSYLGAADTTISSFMTFLLAMILNPDAQKRAQAEIDAVVGSSRLPGFDDEMSLPYVNALVTEVQR